MLEEILRGPLSFDTVAAPALRPFDGLDNAMREVAVEVRRSPARSELHAAIGNGLIRQTRYLEAIEAYRAAVAVSPENASAQLALAELLFIAHDPGAQAQLGRALQQRRLFLDPRREPGAISLLLLLRDAPYSVNAPLDLIVDHRRVALHKYYVEGDLCEALPACDAVFCGFGYARAAESAIRSATSLIERLAIPVINGPGRMIGATRDRLRETLRGIPGVVVPDIRVARASDIAINGALTLVRPIDTQAGIGLALVRNAHELREHLARWPSPSYHVAPFIEYASLDGYYRKYRIVIVDGVAYPYHLGISPRWMVHYRNAPMAENAWMREEEGAFLRDPRSAFSAWDVLADVARRIGLDYVGLDCARLADGTMLVFEADPAMLVHDEEEPGIFAYKRAAVANIRTAITELALRVAGSNIGFREDARNVMRQRETYGNLT